MNRFGFYLSYFTLILHVYFAEYQILDWHFPAFSTSKVCIHCLLFEICCFQVEIQLWGVWLQVWVFSCWQLLSSLLRLLLLPHIWTSWWKSLGATFFLLVGESTHKSPCLHMGTFTTALTSQSQWKPGPSLLLTLWSHPALPIDTSM